ncbi:MAG: hypothetical protein RL654_1412 [Pseudomonadota bacterium]|jgi:hypothetical protein
MKKTGFLLRADGARIMLTLALASTMAGCVVVPVPGHGHHRGHGRDVVVVPQPQPAPRVIIVPEDRRGSHGHDRRGGRWRDD